MATSDMRFNVTALDKASASFIKMAQKVENLSDKLEELDKKKATPEVDIDTAKARAAMAGLADDADKAGKRGSRSFFRALFTPNNAMLMSLRTGIPAVLSSPIGAAGLALGALFAASFGAAIVSAGVFAGIGAGFTAVAAIALRENERIKGSFEALSTSVQADLAQAAQPMVPVFEDALNTVRRMFGTHIADPLSDIFEGLGPSIVPLVESAVRTVGDVLDDLATPKFLTGMETVLDSIADQLPRLGDSVGDFFLTIASNADDISEALGTVVTTLDIMIDLGADAANTLTDSFNLAADVLGPIPGFIKDINDAWNEFVGAEGQGDKNRQFITDLTDAAETGRPPLEALAITMATMFAGGTEGASKFAGEVEKVGDAVPPVSEAVDVMAQREEQLKTQLSGVNDRLAEERDKLSQLKDSLFETSEGVLGLRDSTRSYEEQLDNTRETLEENGRTLDVNTEKGRENQESIDAIAAAALRHIEVMHDQGKSTQQISEFTQNARSDFIDAAEAAGLETEEAKKLADQLGLVPSEVKTQLEAIDNASAKIEALEERIEDIEREIDINVRVHQNVFRVPGGGRIPLGPFAHTGGLIADEGIRRFHSGGRLGHGERMIIGQTGEFIMQRSAVAARGMDFMRAINQGRLPDGAGGPITIENHIEIGGEVVRVVRSEITAEARQTRRGVLSGTGRVR